MSNVELKVKTRYAVEDKDFYKKDKIAPNFKAMLKIFLKSGEVECFVQKQEYVKVGKKIFVHHLKEMVIWKGRFYTLEEIRKMEDFELKAIVLEAAEKSLEGIIFRFANGEWNWDDLPDYVVDADATKKSDPNRVGKQVFRALKEVQQRTTAA